MAQTSFFGSVRRWFAGAVEVRDAWDVVRASVALMASAGFVNWLSAVWKVAPIWVQVLYATGAVLGLFGLLNALASAIRRRRRAESGAPLIVVRNRAYKGEEIVLDGYDYDSCTFTDCTFTYHGGLHRIGENKLSGNRTLGSTNSTVVRAWAVMRAFNLIVPQTLFSTMKIPPLPPGSD